MKAFIVFILTLCTFTINEVHGDQPSNSNSLEYLLKTGFTYEPPNDFPYKSKGAEFRVVISKQKDDKEQTFRSSTIYMKTPVKKGKKWFWLNTKEGIELILPIETVRNIATFPISDKAIVSIVMNSLESQKFFVA